MIEINSNKEKNVIFEVQLSGITPQELTGYLRVYVDGIEYGFPAQISENSIGVDVPALKSIVHRPLRSGEKFKAKLELVGNDNYLVPWDDSVVVKSSVMVEAKIVNEIESSKKPMVKVVESKNIKDSKQEKVPVKPVRKKEIEVTTEHLKQYMEKRGTKTERIQEILLTRCRNKVGDDNKKIFTELYNYYKKDKDPEIKS